jgi:sphinganine-1-phosphate aldolase
LMSEKGWSINSLQRPSAVHFCVTLPTTKDGVAELFLSDLKQVVDDLVNGSISTKGGGEGNAPIYGMTSALPKGPINQMLNSYIDVVLEV